MSSNYYEIIDMSGGNGSGINLPDDHIFATAAARDAAIPNPEEGEQCAVQATKPQYHLLQEYRGDKWVDITYLIEGPEGPQGNEGPQGPAGGKLPHKDLDVSVFGDMNAPEWIAEGNFVYSFDNAKLSELSNSPANDYDYSSDPDRTFVIIHGEQTVNDHSGQTYVTRTFFISESNRVKGYEKEGYIEDNTFYTCTWQPINGMVVYKKLLNNDFQKVPSAFMRFGGGLKPTFDGETTIVTAVAPFSEVVEIFDSTTLTDPEDNRTYVYSTVDLQADHNFWLKLDPNQVVEGYTLSIATAPTSLSSISLYMGTGKELKAPILPGSTIVIKKLKGENQFRIFKAGGGVFLGLDALFLDLAPTNWKDQPINTYFVAEGTFANVNSDVNGKTGKLLAQVINTDVHDNPNSLIVHVYTIISGEDSINGLQFKRVSDTKENFLNAPLVPMSSPSGGDGFVDHGSIDNLTADYKTLADGKWYVDGWQNSSSLPDWTNEDRVATLTVFGGYDGTQNGAFWMLASHRRGIYGAVTSSGVTSDWYKLDGGGVQVDSSNPLEVIAKDGSNHDMIAINDDDDVVIGSRSSTINSLALATHARRIIAYHANDEGEEVYDHVAFTSDLTNIQGGKPRKKRTLYIDGEGYTITEDDIQRDIIIQCEPFIKSGEEYVSTVIFPTLEVVKKYYWIPGVNDADKDNREWSIMDLQISAYVDPESVKTGVNKLILKSADNAFGWGTNTVIGNYDGCYIFRRHDDTSENDDHIFNFMRREVGGSTSGPMGGYTLQSAKENHVYDLNTPTPAPVKNINDARNLSLTSDSDGNVFADFNRTNPIIIQDNVDNLELVYVSSYEDDGVIPKGRKAIPGQMATGFSLCPDGTEAGTEILQLASGTYPLSLLGLTQFFNTDDRNYVFIDDTGKLTLEETEFRVGYIANDGDVTGVVIDIDSYNSSINSKSFDAFDIVTTRVLKIHEGTDNPEKFSEFYVDGNFTYTAHVIGGMDLYVKNKESGDLIKALQVLESGDVDFKGNISSEKLILTNKNESALNNAVLRMDSVNQNLELDAVGSIYVKQYDKNSGELKQAFIVDTAQRVDFKQAIRTSRIQNNAHGWSSNSNTEGSAFVDFAVDNTVTIGAYDKVSIAIGGKKINFGGDTMAFSSTGLGYIRNVGFLSRNTSNDKNSIKLNDGEIVYKSDSHNFKDSNDGDLLSFKKDAGISVHDRKLQDLADGEDETDAATIGQLNAATGIPYLRKFDTTGGDIRAMNYPENRVQAWINYKGDGTKEVSIDSMRNNDSQQFDQIALDNQSQNVCKLRLFYNGASVLKRVLPGEIIQCWTSREFTRWKWVYGSEDSPTSSTSLAIEENNDDIITPENGEQFQLIDSEKSASYGNSNKQVTYFAPVEGTQGAMLLSKLNYGKVFAIHEQINTTKLIMIIHESLVEEIYNRDLTDVNEVTMLFTGDSRGRLAKSNQTAAQQFAINWNGELIPADDDPNELNPTHWVASDDSVTETWSNSVKSVCYSSGVLANRGSAALRRGDVIYSKPESVTHDDSELLETPKHLSTALSDSGETATITYDDNSEFFVMPIVAGGGSFSVMKVFQLFMGRKTQVVENWGSLKFDKSSDCIGTILKIAYDAAIAEEERAEEIQNSIKMELFKMAVESQNKYGTQLVVDLRGEEDAS